MASTMCKHGMLQLSWATWNCVVDVSDKEQMLPFHVKQKARSRSQRKNWSHDPWKKLLCRMAQHKVAAYIYMCLKLCVARFWGQSGYFDVSFHWWQQPRNNIYHTDTNSLCQVCAPNLWLQKQKPTPVCIMVYHFPITFTSLFEFFSTDAQQNVDAYSVFIQMQCKKHI